MRLRCPSCEVHFHIPELPDDDAPVRCPKCKTRFHLPDPDDEDDDSRPVKKAGKKKAKKKAPEKTFPVVPVVAGGLALLVVVGVVIGIVATRSKPDSKPADVAANTDNARRDNFGAGDPRPNPLPQAGGMAGNVGGPGAIAQPGGPGPGFTPPGKVTPTGTPQTAPGTGPGPRQTAPEFPVANLQTVPGPYAELFSQPIDSIPPTIRAATLKPTEANQEPEVPTFHSLITARKEGKNPAPKPVPKDAKLTLDEIKKVCAYIKVDAGDLSGTGSGFLAAAFGNTGLIATNYHVIEAAAGPRYRSSTAKVTAVFNSGQADEREMKAEIVAFDPVADLAILKVQSALPWPKPLNPYNAPSKLVEGTPIQFWGFPLGDILSSGKKNPEITLGTGNVSSLRHTATGKLDRVQISGTMNPGNSGGPLVDADGRLIGIAVSIINPKIGSGIGFAVPVNDLIALLEGKLLTTLFVPIGLDGGQAKFLVFVPVMDPLDKVETVFIRRWAGDGKPPEAVKDPATGYKPFAMRKDGKANLAGVEEFPLKKLLTDSEMASSLGIALGEMTVPLDAGQVLIQVASQTTAHPQTGVQYTAASKPVGYTLTVSDLPVGTDARPFSELTTNPETLAGRVVIVKGRVAAPPVTRGAVQDLVIVGPDGKRPDRLKFLVSGEQAAQFDEVELAHQPLPVRLVCLVGKRGDDGIIPVRVARLDFIGRGNRIVRTLPTPPGPKDDLAALNRNPGGFAGKTLEMNVSAVPLTPRIRDSNEFTVIFSNHRAPRNLTFTISDSIKQRLIEAFGKDLRLNMIVPVRLTIVVPEKPVPPGSKTTVTVTKIEFTDEDGKVIKTIE